jgi:hypothetical protein
VEGEPLFGSITTVTGDALPIHDTAHDAFMTLPPYHSAREDEVRHLSSSRNPAGWAFE